MLFRSFHNNPVNIAHFPGKQKDTLAREMWALADTIPVTLPKDISIISIMTPDVVEKSPLHYQLTKNNIPYINTVPENHKMWVNKQKPAYIIEALKKVKTKYCLILDGNDVVIVDDLSNILWKFDGYDRDIIFNATSNRFPNLKVEDIEGIDDFEGRSLLFGPFCFLNAGVCLGKTSALKWFYKEVMEDCNNSNVPSEQYHVRKIMNLHQDKVFFDYDCRLFQAFNSGMELRGLFPEIDAQKDEEKRKKEQEKLDKQREREEYLNRIIGDQKERRNKVREKDNENKNIEQEAVEEIAEEPANNDSEQEN